jgi:hypothetical protein
LVCCNCRALGRSGAVPAVSGDYGHAAGNLAGFLLANSLSGKIATKRPWMSCWKLLHERTTMNRWAQMGLPTKTREVAGS